MRNSFYLMFLFLMGMLLQSCSSSTYEKWNSKIFVNGLLWKAKDTIVFEPEIKDITKKYNIIIGIRHHFGLKLNFIPIVIEITEPSGNKSVYQYDYVIKENNEISGDCAGDLCDIERIVISDYSFSQQGKYKIKITNDFQIVGIMKLGLIIKETDKNN